MSNELILILNLIFTYGSVLIWLKLFGERGLICFNILATILANIEVIILVNAFGLDQTLGNILFASTFLVSDILNEKYGRKTANIAANMSILATVFFLIITQSWLLYSPLAGNSEFYDLKNIFSKTPRIIVSGFIVYAITQKLDIFLYQKIWSNTKKRCGNGEKYLWVRNNISTLISQLVNTVLFTLFAFLGKLNLFALLEIMVSSYVIFIITSIADTPILYFARHIKSITSEE